MADQKSNLTSVPAPRNAADNEIRPVTADTLNVPADYVRKLDREQHTTEHVHGNRTTFETDTKTDDESNGVFDNRVLALVDGALTDRKQAEDKRANHRNFNRLMTLFGAVIIGLVVTWASQRGIIPKALAPYTFVITVLLDSTFSLYALIRHY